MSTKDNPPSADDNTEPEFGPYMKALSEKQRKFVLAMFSDPDGSASDWARVAGYIDTKGQTAKVQASRNLSNQRVVDAINEFARMNLSARGAVLVVNNLVRIAADPNHRKHFEATLALADRAGLHPRTEQKIDVTHRADEKEMEALVVRLAQEMGINPADLLGTAHLTAAELENYKPPRPIMIEAQAIVEEEADVTPDTT